MKLRSGKIVKQPLPIILEKKLNEDLQTLKELLANNEEFAKELIQLISLAPGINARIAMSDMIRELVGDRDVELHEFLSDLLATSGSLLMLVTGYNEVYQENHILPIFHDDIQARMLGAYDIDASFIGDQ